MSKNKNRKNGPQAGSVAQSETPEVIIVDNNDILTDAEIDQAIAIEDEAPVELPAEDQPLEVINEEISTPAPEADPVKLVIVTTSRASHGTPGSKSTVTNPIPQSVLDAVKEAKLNTCNAVKSLYATGYTRAQIVAAGYNASTVYRQVKEYIDGKGVTNNAEAAFEAAAIKIDEAAEKIDENAELPIREEADSMGVEV